MGTRSGGRRSAASMGAELSDADLRARLLELGQSVGPVTATTRGVMLRKLAALEAGSAKAKSSTSTTSTTTTSSSSSKVIRARGGGAGNRRVDAFMFSSDSDDDDGGGGGGGGGGDRGGIGVAGRGGEGRLPAPKRTSLGVGFVAGRPRPQDGAVRTREVGTDPRKKAAFRQQQQEATAAYSDDDVVYARGGGGHVDGAAEEEEEEEEEEEMDTRDDVYSRTAPVSGLGLFQSEFARHLEAGGGRPMPTKPIAASSSPYGNGRRSGLDIGYPSSSYYSSSSKSYSSTAAGAAPSRDLLAGFDTSSRIGSSSSRIGSRYSSGDSGGLRSNPIASSSSSVLSLRHGALGGGDDGARGGIGGGGEQRSSAPQELDRPRRSRFPELSSGRSDATGIDAATWSGYFPSTSGWFSSRGGGADGGVGGGGGGSGGGGAGSSSAGTAGSRDVPFAPSSSSSQLYSRKNFASHCEPDGDSGLGGGSSFKLGLARAEVGNFDSYLRGGGGEGRVEAKREPLVSSAALRKRGGGTTAKRAAAVDKTTAADSFYVRYKSNLLRIGLGMLLVWMAIIYLLTCGENSDEFKAPCETTECEKRGVDEICGKMHSLLAIRAGECDCGYLKGQKAELPVEKVKEDPEIKSYDETVFHKALEAIVKNEARFGIKVRGLDANVKVVNASDVKFLESIHLQRSFVCRLRNAVVQTVVRLLIIFLAIAVLWGLYLYAKLWLKQKGERKKQVFELVEKISELVQQQMLDSQTNWRVQPFLPIPHVRDSLIKPQDRDRMRPVWEQAVQFIDAGESRIRTENQLLHGQDCEVWRWTSLPTSPGSSPAASP